MCSDLFLSFLYFSILFIVNFFLFFLTKNSFLEISFLFKIKKILNYFKNKKKNFYFFFYFFEKINYSKHFNYFLLFSKKAKSEKMQDIITIKNYLLFFKTKKAFSTQYYLNLLKIQYSTF